MHRDSPCLQRHPGGVVGRRATHTTLRSQRRTNYSSSIAATATARIAQLKTMDAEVVVVGAGIGGLTAAALLAARGMNVCVLERASSLGGCAANFEKFGYSFEAGD